MFQTIDSLYVSLYFHCFRNNTQYVERQNMARREKTRAACGSVMVGHLSPAVLSHSTQSSYPYSLSSIVVLLCFRLVKITFLSPLHR